ncbi:hypothetical protein JTE90_023075 [Oedothorax gibbosus]|uniref:Uncharacterized protein n=1 Tax=Oedothorax gibbosus TaxID=931172 RepID=A0AAV6UW65_9ARAC|nr:hypothetical protein JTE90_023075 [Oedothorax gibbosus]
MLFRTFSGFGWNSKERCQRQRRKVGTFIRKGEKVQKKYRAAKEEVLTTSYREPESIKEICPNVRVPQEKLALCRVTDSSKYTGDLMEVVFGSRWVQDIEAHIALKFGVARREVRYALRLKLNYMHKLHREEMLVMKVEKIM